MRGRKERGQGWGHLSPELARTLLSWGGLHSPRKEPVTSHTLSLSPDFQLPRNVHAQRPRGPQRPPAAGACEPGLRVPASSQHRATPRPAPRRTPSWTHTFTCQDPSAAQRGNHYHTRAHSSANQSVRCGVHDLMDVCKTPDSLS